MGRGKNISVFVLLALCYGAGARGDSNPCSRYFWTNELVLQALRGLHEKKIDLAAGKLAHNTTNDLRETIRSIIGRPISGAALHRASSKYFGSYAEALKAAGIEFNEVAKYSRFSKAAIRQGLKALYQAKISLHPRTLATDFSEHTRSTLRDSTGLASSGALLFRKAYRFYAGGYRAALIDAGIDPTTQSVHFNRQVMMQRLASDFAEDDRIRYMSRRVGPYEELRFQELSEALLRCAYELPDNQRESALDFLEGAVQDGRSDSTWPKYFSDCLANARLDF